MEEALAPALHLVAQAGDVLQGDLGLGGHGASPAQGEGLRRLEAHLLPLQGAGGLLCGYGAEVDGEVHGRTGGHQPLEEAGGECAGPAPQMERADQALADADLATVDRHLDALVLVAVRR